MDNRSRNLFLAALAVVALVGIVVIVLATRPKNDTASTSNTANLPTKTITWTVNGQEQKVTAKAVKGDLAKDARFSLGKEDAPVTIVEFANYECGYCKRFAEETRPQLISEFVDTGKVRFLYRDFPFAGQASVVRASQAAACANDQGRYWDYHDVLYRAQSTWFPMSGEALDAQLADFAGQIGLDGAALKSCVQSNKHQQAVNDDGQAAVNAGLSGTPAFIIDGYAYEAAMPIEAFRKILAEAGAK